MATDHTSRRWLNRTVFGIGLASLCSDWSHEIASAVLPAYLATMGAAAAWLGFIEGTSDGLASFAKLLSGFYTDRLRRRKPIAVAGPVLTAPGPAPLGFSPAAGPVLAAPPSPRARAGRAPCRCDFAASSSRWACLALATLRIPC